MARPTGASPSTRTFLGAPPTPRFGVSEAKLQNPGRKCAAGRMECVLFEMSSEEAASAVVIIVPSPARGGHERREPRIWRNEPNCHFGQTKPRIIWPSGSPPRGAPRDARVAGTPLRGPMITAGGYGSRLSLRSAGTTMAWPERRTNRRLYERTAGAISLFPIVIYNDLCNSHVSLASSAQILFTAIPRR
jgi:hypothetical protein